MDTLSLPFPGTNTETLSQYFTPPWLAEAIVGRYFGWLGDSDTVIEPSCGLGSFLNPISASTRAIGVEVDADIAEKCRSLTGREVIVGSFQNVDLPVSEVSAVIGNPPFKADVIDQFLMRSHGLLPNEGVVGMILPAYLFQTAKRVVGYTENWSIQSTMIPRSAFPRLSKQVVFAMFTKDKKRTLVGLAFYVEAAAVDGLPKEIRKIFTEQGSPMWPRVVEEALIAIGGRGRLADIYRAVDGNQPTANKWWEAQVRRVLQERFVRVGRGEWAHPNADAHQRLVV